MFPHRYGMENLDRQTQCLLCHKSLKWYHCLCCDESLYSLKNTTKQTNTWTKKITFSVPFNNVIKHQNGEKGVGGGGGGGGNRFYQRENFYWAGTLIAYRSKYLNMSIERFFFLV